MSFRTNNSVVQGIVDSGISSKIGVTLQGYDAKLAGIAGLSLAGNGSKALVVNGAGDAISFSEQMLGSAAFLSTGTSAGNIPVLDGSGKLASSVLPAIKVGDVSVVADLEARDDIVDAVEGDIAIVSSESKTYVFDGSAWQEMLSPAGAASVTSVNGQTGAVSLAANDLTDVDVTSPASGQVLRFNGTAFVNAVVDYADLANKPTLFDGQYSSLTGAPVLADVATSGDYADLANKPTLFSGSYEDLTDKPVLFSGDYADLANKPTLGTMAAQASADYYTKSEVDTAISGVSGDSSVAKSVVVKTDAGDVTATSSNHIIIINKAVGEATSVTLPAAPATGKMVVIKDGKGDASVNNITIVGTVDGATNAIIDASYESVTVVYNGTQWNII